MDCETLGKKIGIREELIKKSCTLSLKDQFSNELFHVDKSSADAVFIVFTRSWTVKEWFSGDQAFGETRINSKDWSKKAFPSMRSIGNDDVAIVNQAFLERFELVSEDSKFVEEVTSAMDGKKPIIFTGHSSGGAVAVLATIWFLERQSSKASTRTAKCVTFGSPLVGDYIVSHALKREKWSKYFIHFVMRYDIVPRILLAPLSSIHQELEHVLHYFTANGHHYPRESIAPDFYTNVMTKASSLASHAACRLMGNTDLLLETLTNFTELSPYRPFGTYIFCIGNGKLVHLDHPEAVLQLLFFSCQLSHENKMEATARCCINAHLDYATELGRSLEENVVYVDRLEELPLASDGSALDDLGLSTRGRLCLCAVGELEKQKQKNQQQIERKKAEMEEGMKGLEEYRTFNAKKVGYYDAFKKQNEKRDFDANVRRLVLAGIWDEIIEMLKRYDLPDEFEGEDSWIDLGTKFRRLVEPLDIANYYGHAKNEDTGAYMIKARPRRYIYPQRWLEKKKDWKSGACAESCFWAEVEELLKLASNGGKVDETRARVFQEEIAQWIEQGVAGEDVFLEDSTFLKLWEELGRLKLQQESIHTLMTKFTKLSFCCLSRQTEENLKSGKQQIGENLKMRNRKTAENLNMWNQFSSGLESANLLVNSDLVHQAWDAIVVQRDINRYAEQSLCTVIRKSNLTVLAFGTPFGSLQGKKGLISSSTLMEEDFPHFEFLCNKSNPRFSINESAILIFRANYDDLNLLKTQLVQMSSCTSSLIITGCSLGGSVAILFTLWLLHSFNLSKNILPLCITFGAPLLGDERLRQCVSEFSTWKSCFLCVASNQDPRPKLFLSQNPSGTYKPFGTFLLCSASGCACFEEPDTILEWLVIVNSQNFQTQDPYQFIDYGLILKDLKLRALYRDDLQFFAEGKIGPLQASIITQLQAIGFPLTQQKEPYTEANSVIKRMERHEKLLTQRKNVSDSFKKLSEMQLCMARLGLYKKEAKRKKIGYYDMYKKLQNTSDIYVYDYKKKLMSYWQESVAEKECKPHEEGDFFWTSWLMAGTSYRRMVEPLHTAEHYMEDGAENYITDRRPRHFILLEQWWKERERPEASQNNAWIKRQVAASRLNEDSCFWAHVEAAIISCNLLNNYKESNIQDTESSKQKLKEFEGYVYDAIKNNEVSLDIFLEGSSFRQWWNKYEAFMGSSYCSSLMLKFWEGMGARSSPSS